MLEELTQELAFKEFQERKEAGEVTLGGEGIAADMLVELALEDAPELTVESKEQGEDAVMAELLEYVEKHYINESEMKMIFETVKKFNHAYLEAFTGRKIPGLPDRTDKEVIQQAYEGMRDNARKITYQTKKDKNVFSGSDHGTRHKGERVPIGGIVMNHTPVWFSVVR